MIHVAPAGASVLTCAGLLAAFVPGDLFVDRVAADCAAADGSAALPYCEIADALAVALDGDVIHVAPGTYRGGLVLEEDVTIRGTAGDAATVLASPGPGVTVLTVAATSSAVVEGLTVRDGSVSQGAAGLDVEGELRLRNATVTANSGGIGYGGTDTASNQVTGVLQAEGCRIVGNDTGGFGGGLLVTGEGDVTLVDCDVSSNLSGFAGITGGAGGGIAVSDAGSTGCGPSLVLRNTTVSDNAAGQIFFTGAGGGVFVDSQCDIHMQLVNTTVSGNSADESGGVFVRAHGSGTTLELTACTLTANGQENGGSLGVVSPIPAVLRDSIVSALGYGYYARDLAGNVVSGGHNVVGSVGGAFGGASFVPRPSDQQVVDLSLEPLAEGGGVGRTHALPAGSPAIDAGSPAPPAATDQRGVPRPVGLSDVGAYERGGVGSPVQCPAEPNSTGAPGTITTQGSDAAAENDLRVVAGSLPAGEFGLFALSRLEGFVPMVGGGQGNLCLGGAIVRVLASVQMIDADGQAVLALDLTAVPRPGGAAPVSAGDTRVFQFWHRDVHPGATSNLSAAVSVTFR